MRETLTFPLLSALYQCFCDVKLGTINVADQRRVQVAKDSKDQQLIELKDTIKELNITIRNLKAMIDDVRGKIIEYYSINYGCPKCKTEAEVPYIVKGKDGHPHMLHGMASAATVAWVMYQKYVNSLPLYRQEKDFKALYGVDISRGTISNWIIDNAEDFFTPLCNYLRRKLVSGPYAMADETPVQVLKEPGRRPETKSYMWVSRTGEFDKEQIVLFHYSETRAG